ncbi:MAG: DDE-type integrase/transposase/recombinase [Pleurocapsa sp. MO_226.B13]|nr:DDE-type integrase/transposase/recombinase [Pleurocapsa sp. MO_226.B13]
MVNLAPEKLSEDISMAIVDISKEKEYMIFSELSESDKLKMKLIEGIRHASDLKTKTRLIKEAADKLDKSTITIRRMVLKVEQEGLAALASTVRSDKGQFRISPEWREKIIKLYEKKRRILNKKNTNKKLAVNCFQIWKLIEAEAKQLGLKDGEFPSHVTVYKVLEPFLNKKKLRHPGQGLKQFIQTTDGQLELTHSNQIFQCDHTNSDVLLVDVDGNEIGRPYLTTVIESNSGCIVGFHISFKKPGSHEVALALRHAFLPKEYDEEYKLQKEWNVSGVPQYFITDRAKEFKSNHLKQIAAQLGIELRLRAYPQQGGLVERPFGTINTEFLESIPGYTGSNIHKRPQNAEEQACFTLDEFERLLVRFIVDNYNQNPYPRAKNQTRVSRWESMLLEPLEKIDERKLDICLLKSTQRKLQAKGQIQFENEIYKGECLRYCQSEYITLRYDPSNILRLMAYTKEENGQPAKYLGIIQAKDRTEPFSIREQKAKSKRITRESKQLDRTSIYSERLDRQQAVENKRKQSKANNRKKEQKRIERDRTGINIVEFKAPVRDDNQTAIANQKKLLVMKPVTLKSRQNKPKVKPAKVKASNWDRFINHNY